MPVNEAISIRDSHEDQSGAYKENIKNSRHREGCVYNNEVIGVAK